MRIITLPTLLCRFQGLALGWVILIKRGHENLIDHEMIHIKQQKRCGFWTYMLRWWFSEEFRAKVEIEAYRVADGLGDKAIIDKLVDLYGIAPGMAYRYVLEVK
jgi:hypothetical protein